MSVRRAQPAKGLPGCPWPAAGRTSSEPDSGCGRARPVRAVVMYRSLRSGPPKAQAVGRADGQLDHAVQCAVRRVAADRRAVPQGDPDTAVGVDGQPVGEARAVLDARRRGRRSGRRARPSWSKTSIAAGRGVDVVHEPAVGAPARAVADGHVGEDLVDRAVGGDAGQACRRPAPRRSAWCRPTASRRARRRRRCRGGRARARGRSQRNAAVGVAVDRPTPSRRLTTRPPPARGFAAPTCCSVARTVRRPVAGS